MPIEFEDVAELPVAQRENEFREVIAAMAQGKTANLKSYVISENTLEESQAKLAADKRKMAEAGNEVTKTEKKDGKDVTSPAPVTVRTPRVDTLDDGKSLKVYFTTVKKIVRKSGKKAETPAAVAPAEKTTLKSAK